MRGDGIRRYLNGANAQPPHGALLRLEEVGALDNARRDLRVLAEALPTAGQRRDAATAGRAIDRLFAADALKRHPYGR